MMERQFAKFFLNLVKELIPNEDDRDQLFSLLRHYQATQDLNRLLSDLRILLNEPNKLELYDFMRPMILMGHQIEYSRRVPAVPGVKLRVIRLMRRPGESLGFAVRGGFEHGVGIFVTQVTLGSQAERQGLRVGDEIVKVNGFNISEAIHEDVLNLIKSKDEIVLKVTNIGMLPTKNEPTDLVKWEYVNSLLEDSNQDEGKRNQPRDIKIFIDSSGHASIGCSIFSESGPTARYPGIYVEKVRPGSIAEEVGLEAGDQIVEVNDISFRNITWTEAVLALKSSRQLNMIIRKKTGSQQLQRLTSGNRRESVISYNSVSTRPSIDLGSSYRNDRRESLRDFSPNNSGNNNFRSLTPPLESPPPEVEERRESKLWNHNIRLDELQLVQQELARKRLIEGNSVAPHSYTESSRPSTTPVLNTKAEVHVTPPATRMYTRPDPIESAPLGGAAAVLAERRLSNHASNLPGILGPPEEFEWISKVPSHVYQRFSLEELEGRPLKGLIYKRTLDLGVDIEGGIGSPLGGKILVAVVFEGGVAQMSGQIRAGDQLMMINGQSLVNVTCTQAERIINDAPNTARDRVELYYCETTLVNDEDSVTYF